MKKLLIIPIAFLISCGENHIEWRKPKTEEPKPFQERPVSQPARNDESNADTIRTPIGLIPNINGWEEEIKEQ